MKTPTHLVVAAVLLLMTFLYSAEAKNVERATEKAEVVSVGAHVTRPGAIEYRNTTIYAMILAAGAPTPYGTLKRVKVLRDGKEFRLNLTKEKVKNEEFAKPGDIIEVPELNVFERNQTNNKG
jgi:hypothetical protein